VAFRGDARPGAPRPPPAPPPPPPRAAAASPLAAAPNGLRCPGVQGAPALPDLIAASGYLFVLVNAQVAAGLVSRRLYWLALAWRAPCAHPGPCGPAALRRLRGAACRACLRSGSSRRRRGTAAYFIFLVKTLRRDLGPSGARSTGGASKKVVVLVLSLAPAPVAFWLSSV